MADCGQLTPSVQVPCRPECGKNCHDPQWLNGAETETLLVRGAEYVVSVPLCRAYGSYAVGRVAALATAWGQHFGTEFLHKDRVEDSLWRTHSPYQRWQVDRALGELIPAAFDNNRTAYYDLAEVIARFPESVCGECGKSYPKWDREFQDRDGQRVNGAFKWPAAVCSSWCQDAGVRRELAEDKRFTRQRRAREREQRAIRKGRQTLKDIRAFLRGGPQGNE